jgi:hypothetical protein
LDLIKPLEEEQCLAVDQLLNIYRDISANIYLDVLWPVSLHHTLPYKLDNKMELIELCIRNELDIQTVGKMLATPRADGRQHVAYLNFYIVEFPQRILAIVKKVKKILIIFINNSKGIAKTHWDISIYKQ